MLADQPTAASWLDASPRLRVGVRVGPQLFHTSTPVHFVADTQTHNYFRVGPREAFLMDGLDGRRTLAGLGQEYATTFGARLGPSNWGQLLGMLGQRGLLDPVPEGELLGMRARADARRQAQGRRWFRYRVPLPGAVNGIPALSRALGWLFHPLALVPLSLLGLAVCLWVVAQWATISPVFTVGIADQGILLSSVVITWVVVMLHELGHGIACHRFGGMPQEIGIMWRLPLLAPYCKVDDVLAFPARSQRITTAYAGIYVHLVTMIPFALLWWASSDGGRAQQLSAVLLVVGAVSVLSNCLPVLNLDGYRMVEHATGTWGLQGSSYTFLGEVLRRDRAALARYPARLRWTYGGYGITSVVVLGVAAVLIVRFWWVTLAAAWGPTQAAAFLIGEAIVVAGLVTYLRRRSARSASVAEVPL